MNRFRVWWLRLRGYKRFEVTRRGGAVVAGWAKETDYDPRDPTVTYRGWTDEGSVITFHGYTPPPPKPVNCRCSPPDIQDVTGHMEEHAAPK